MGQLSEVAIYNMALDMLDEAPVTAPSDDTRAARLLARNYAQTRDEVLRAHPWNFAMARSLLAAAATGPAFGWARAFPLPADCLRLLPVVSGGHLNGAPVAHEVEGGAVLTDAPAPLAVRYVRRVANPSEFDPLFARALAARLAVYVGHVLTGKQSYIERIGRIYSDILVESRRIDALEATAPVPLGEDWIEARY
jgi:hypothetical protein